MPGENIYDWSTTASSNSNADTSINWAEGQPRASVNNSARSMMAAHAKNRNLMTGAITTTGSANAQAFVSGGGHTAVPSNMRVMLKIGFTNTGPATLDMDGIGAAPIKTRFGAALIGGELIANSYAEFRYDGTSWLMLQDSSLGVFMNGSIVTTGTVNVQAFATGVPFLSVPANMRVLLKIGPGLTNTGPATLNMDGIAAVPIKNQFGGPLVGGELLADGYAEFRYDGTSWILLQDTGVGWVLHSKQTVTNATGAIFTNLTSAYAHYVFLISGLIPGTKESTLRFAVSSNNCASYIENAYFDEVGFHNSLAGGTSPIIYSNSANLIGQISTALDNALPTTPCDAIVHLFGSARAQIPQLSSVCVHYHNTAGLIWNDTRNMVSTTNINAIIFECFPGLIATGTFSAYGVKG